MADLVEPVDITENIAEARRLQHLPDEVLISIAALPDSPRQEIEMQRRLKDSVEALTAETIASRESAERLTGELNTKIGDLTGELITFRTSSDEAARKLARLTTWLIVFTIVLVILTVAVVLTAVLVPKGNG